MESFKHKLEEEKKVSGLDVEIKAGISEEVRLTFGEDYSKRPENIKMFIDITLSKILNKLPENIKAVDLGGASGDLIKAFRDKLEGIGKHVDLSIADGNKDFIDNAQKLGLKSVVVDLSKEIPFREMDLVIMRNVLHYNSLEDIKKILKNTKDSLKEGGFFVNQVISAIDENHVSFINEILSTEVLGRGANYLTNEEYLKFCKEVGLSTDFAGYAPSGKWTLKEMFWRTYPKKMGAKGVEDLSVFDEEEKKEYYQKRDIYVEKCRNILKKYEKEEKIDDIEFNEEETEIEFYGPIFISQKEQ